ncbi:hypothetical protein EDB86DRAFT_2829533 [Lactarius hatsudake]|nr:hypothetical protein EDB86DRAFT_2829533 [Lactarius hatsudake]
MAREVENARKREEGKGKMVTPHTRGEERKEGQKEAKGGSEWVAGRRQQGNLTEVGTEMWQGEQPQDEDEGSRKRMGRTTPRTRRPRGGEKERSAARAVPYRLGEGGQGESKRVRTAKTVLRRGLGGCTSHARARDEQESSDSKDGGLCLPREGEKDVKRALTRRHRAVGGQNGQWAVADEGGEANVVTIESNRRRPDANQISSFLCTFFGGRLTMETI